MSKLKKTIDKRNSVHKTFEVLNMPTRKIGGNNLLQLFNRIAKSNNIGTIQLVEDILEKSINDLIDSNSEMAKSWTIHAAKELDYSSIIRLIDLHLEFEDYSDELNKIVQALQLNEKREVLGSDLIYIIGVCYFNGYGVEKCEGTGFKYIKMASSNNFEPATLALVKIYLKGLDNVKKNPQKGINLLTELAESECTQAEYLLGKYYHNGKYVNKNDELAFKLINSAAQKYHKGAIEKLIKFYSKGIGTKKNKNKSEEWKDML